MESVYAECIERVAQIFVEGRPSEHFLVAIVVPSDTDAVCPASESPTKKPEAERTDMNLLRRRLSFLQALRAFGAAKGLSGIEQIGNLRLLSEGTFFSPPERINTGDKLATAAAISNDAILTPTLKIKRERMRRKFATLIDEMYAEGRLC